MSIISMLYFIFRYENSDSALIYFFFLSYLQVPTNDPHLNGLEFAKIWARKVWVVRMCELGGMCAWLRDGIRCVVSELLLRMLATKDVC